jgi:hypothetical protein
MKTLLLLAVLILCPAPALAGCAQINEWTGSMTTAGGTDNYINLGWHGMAATYVTASRPHMRVPIDMTIRDLAVIITTPPGTGDAWRFTVTVNGVGSAVTCEIWNLDLTCSSTGTADLSQGDEISLWAESDAGATDADNPVNTIMNFCLEGA